MRESIYSIPITDVFNDEKGCPFCRLYDMLESRCIGYISGAAMMEPEVRIETNRLGFCKNHLEMLLSLQKKLSAALILETHIKELLCKAGEPYDKKSTNEHTCFVCNEIASAEKKMFENAVHLSAKEPEFAAKMASAEFYCKKHFAILNSTAYSLLSKKQAAAFMQPIIFLQEKYLQKLYNDLHDFSLMFDYRNSGKEKNDDAITSFDRVKSYLGSK